LAYVVDRVVVCDAFREPDRHYQLLPGGRSKRVETRRPSMRFLASAKDVKGGIAGVVGKEAGLFDDLSAAAAEQNEFVNQLRRRGARVARGRVSGHGRGHAAAPRVVVRARREALSEREARLIWLGEWTTL
jgi:hypothetical protein